MSYTIPKTIEDVSQGDVIYIYRWGIIRHWGIVTSVGTVISNSGRHGGVIEQLFDDFSCGQMVKKVGYIGSLAPWDVENRARSAIGKGYEALFNNCEHFAYWAHGKRPQSPQVFTVFMALGLAMAAVTFSRVK